MKADHHCNIDPLLLEYFEHMFGSEIDSNKHSIEFIMDVIITHAGRDNYQSNRIRNRR